MATPFCCLPALCSIGFSLLLASCYDAPRDNPFDPALTPAVELLAVTVDSTRGSALLEWTPYEGKQSFAEYRVLRQVRGLVAADTVAKIADVHQTTFRDTTLRPDVAYGYWVEVVNEGGFDVQSAGRAEVVYALPGVELLQAEFSSNTATAKFLWTRYRGPNFAAYEVRWNEFERMETATCRGGRLFSVPWAKNSGLEYGHNHPCHGHYNASDGHQPGTEDRTGPVPKFALLDSVHLTYKFTYMSTKTIAVDSKVYHKLARLRGDGESFSRVIDRLVERALTAHTGAEILASMGAAPAPLSSAEARQIEKAVKRNRRAEKWELHDLS